MAYTQRLVYEPLRTFNSATLNGSYQALGTPLAHPASIVKVVNNSTATVTVSTDGVTDMDVCPTVSFFLYDLTTNRPTSSDGEFIAQGTQFYIKGGAGVGSIYLVVLYIVKV